MFLTSKCLKCRTVARQTCSMCSKCRTLVNLDLPLGSRWAEGSRTEFWRLSKLVQFLIKSLYTLCIFWLPRLPEVFGKPSGLVGGSRSLYFTALGGSQCAGSLYFTALGGSQCARSLHVTALGGSQCARSLYFTALGGSQLARLPSTFAIVTFCR